MNDKNLLLLDKLITLTKEHKLDWEVYEQSDLELNLEKTSFFNTSISTRLLAQPFIPVYSRSYIARFNKGSIGLFAYTYMALSNRVELVLQADDESSPTTIVTCTHRPSSKVMRKRAEQSSLFFFSTSAFAHSTSLLSTKSGTRIIAVHLKADLWVKSPMALSVHHKPSSGGTTYSKNPSIW